MKQAGKVAVFLAALAWAGGARGSVNEDAAANYGGGWTNGANGGGGFGAWSFTLEAGAGWAGCGIWDSGAASLNLGTSFGYVAKGEGAWIAMDRPFSQAMSAGDTLKVDLGLNYDSGAGGNKGFALRTSDNREVVVVNQAGTEVITVNGVAALTNYGVGTMYWTFTQVSATQVAVHATGRGGSEVYSATVGTNASSWLANLRFYASGITNDADVERRQVYFDNLRLSQGASDTNLFRYSVANGRATITGVLASASGDIIVPATLGGYAVGAVERLAFQDLTHVTGVSFAGGASVTNLGPMAFQGCAALRTVTLPGGVAALPAGLFEGCVALETVVLPEGVTNIGDAAFAECRSLRGVSLPGGVTALGESVFLNCRSLESLVLPAGIASIPNQLCYECRGLTSLGLPAGVGSIGAAAFFNCFGLGSLEVPAGVTAIGKDAFKGCAGLATVEVAGAVASVGDEAFFGCDALARFYFRGAVASLSNGVFGACGALAGVYFASHAPSLGGDGGTNLFAGSEGVRVYHHLATDGWPTVPEAWALRPTAIWGAAQDQTITFPAIGDQVVTNAVGLSATASSGLAVSFAVGSGPAEISGGTHLTFTGTGGVSIVASQGGDADWNPAPSVTNWFTVAGGGEEELAAVGISGWAEVPEGGGGFSAVVATDPADAEVEIFVDGASVFDAEARGFVFGALVEGTDYEVTGKTVTILEGGTNAWRWYRIRAAPR